MTAPRVCNFPSTRALDTVLEPTVRQSCVTSLTYWNRLGSVVIEGIETCHGKAKRQTETLLEEASLSASDLFRGLPRSMMQAIAAHSAVRDSPSGHVFFRLGE